MFAVISEVFKKNNLELFLAVPPPLYYGCAIGTNQVVLSVLNVSICRGSLSTFQKDDLERLAPYVKGFSLMTYDYSDPSRYGLHTKELLSLIRCRI